MPRLGCCAPRPGPRCCSRSKALECAYSLIRDPGSEPQMISLIGPRPGFDPGYAMTTDPDDPVIITTIIIIITTAGGEPAGPLLIDG